MGRGKVGECRERLAEDVGSRDIDTHNTMRYIVTMYKIVKNKLNE